MNNIQQRFIEGLQSQGIAPENRRILLCVSGGIDSTVMAHLFFQAGYSIGIAHVNFEIRGSEAYEDECFSRELAEKFHAPFFVYHAGKALEERDKGESIQMAARRIRYRWFRQLLNQGAFALAATAHHADDEFETFLMNINRGAGGKGLGGYDYISGQFIKPLLSFTRDELSRYAAENEIAWREDSSNSKEVYLRNRIRHTIIPAIRKVFPEFIQRMHKSFIRLKRERMLMESLVDRISGQLMVHSPDGIEIEAAALLELPDPPMMLFEMVRKYGFSMMDCESICLNLTRPHGQLYFTEAWTIRLERDKIFIVSNLNIDTSQTPGLVLAEVAEMPDNIGKIPKTAAYLDLDKTGRNLYIRKWQKGDYFYPSGMEGRKLVSDFLNEQKIPFNRRSEQYLLMRGDDVVWVLNFRVDRRFAANKNSGGILLAKTC